MAELNNGRKNERVKISNGLNLIISSSPHISKGETTPKIMWRVFCALLPAGIVGVWLFGIHALELILISVFGAIAFEAICQRLRGKKVSIYDGSAALTGLLLAYCLPPDVPWWLALVGVFVAVVIAKEAFGGLGNNIFNPALVGRVFLLAAWPLHMTNWSGPWHLDAVSQATPLGIIKEGLNIPLPSYIGLFLGTYGGSIGEVSVLMLLGGVIYLIYKRIITWHTPVIYIATTALLSWTFSGKGLFTGDLLFSMLTGGLFLGAFFMATDYVTTPITVRGRLIFGLGCGIITFIIRKFGGYPEGVSYAILLMNASVPLIDRFTHPRRFGR